MKVWLRAIASVALLAFCFASLDASELRQAVEGISPGYFLLAFLSSAVGTVLVRAWIARMTTKASGLSLDWSSLVRINLIARFYTIFLPRGASAVIRWNHYRSGGSGHAAAALLMFENLVSIFTLFSSAALLLTWHAHDRGTVALLVVTVVGTLSTLAALLPFLHPPSGRIAERLLCALGQRLPPIRSLTERFTVAVSAYRKIPASVVLMIFLASVVGYTFFVLSAWVLAQGMELGVDLLSIAWVRSVTLLLALIPITVAGLGVREASFITLLGTLGVAPAAAFAFSIATFTIQLVLGFVGAVLEAKRVFLDNGPVNKAKER